MASSTTFKIAGLRELSGMLDRLPKRVTRKVLNKALRMGAKPIIKKARSNVPQDTKALKKGLGTELVKGRPANFPWIKVGTTRKKISVGGKTVRASTHGFMQEFGTTSHGPSESGILIFRNKQGALVITERVDGIQKRPFLRPAANARKNQAILAIKNAIAPAIIKELNSIKSKGKL